MGYWIISKPGSKFGPCKDPCDHLDCKDNRDMINSECELCKKKLEYEEKFFSFQDGTFHHWMCHWRNQK